MLGAWRDWKPHSQERPQTYWESDWSVQCRSSSFLDTKAMTTHICNKKIPFLHTAISDMCWLIQTSPQPGCHRLLPHLCWNFNYCIVILGHPAPNPPSSIVIATKLYTLEPTAAAGAILCINRQSLSRGTSKHPPQAQKVLPIISVIGCLHWGNWCVYNWPCLHWRFSDILGSPSPSLPWWKLWNPKGTAQIKGKSPLHAPHLARLGLEGQSIEFNPRHLLSTANRIWALASCEITSEAKNGDAVQRTTWTTDILHRTVYKNQAQHLLHMHLLKKRWSFHLWLTKYLLDQIAELKSFTGSSDADAVDCLALAEIHHHCSHWRRLKDSRNRYCQSRWWCHVSLMLRDIMSASHVCETPAELGCTNAVINSPCLHLEGFHSQWTEKTSLHALSQLL